MAKIELSEEEKVVEEADVFQSQKAGKYTRKNDERRIPARLNIMYQYFQVEKLIGLRLN
jgi:hypothetical protein